MKLVVPLLVTQSPSFFLSFFLFFFFQHYIVVIECELCSAIREEVNKTSYSRSNLFCGYLYSFTVRALTTSGMLTAESNVTIKIDPANVGPVQNLKVQFKSGYHNGHNFSYNASYPDVWFQDRFLLTWDPPAGEASASIVVLCSSYSK